MSRQKHENQPSQQMVLYNSEPTIDHDQLTTTIDQTEPGAPACRVTERGAVVLGDLIVAMTHHPDPMPEKLRSVTIRASNLSDEAKSPLRMHTRHTLLVVMGDGPPIERMIALHKVAMGLLAQGAIGVANPQTWSAYTAETFDLLRQPGAWYEFRRLGIPAYLAAGFVKLYAAPDELWFVSKGYSLYGLPELGYRAEGHHEAEYWYDLFANIFHYMFEQGPVIEPGDEMDTPDGGLLNFEAAEGVDFVDGLLVTKVS